MTSQIPICPLMSAGTDKDVICAQERCAWYMKNYKTCAVYMLAHNAALDVRAKQQASKK